MPFKSPETTKCPKCSQNVYAAEEVPAAGKKWHKMCFKCGLCKKMLEAMTVAEHEGNVYCKQCYARKFGPKGYGFGQGAGTLGMDTGEHLGNRRITLLMTTTDKHLSLSPFVKIYNVFIDNITRKKN